MRKITIKLLAMLLAMTMLASMIPMVSLADDGLNEELVFQLASDPDVIALFTEMAVTAVNEVSDYIPGYGDGYKEQNIFLVNYLMLTVPATFWETLADASTDVFTVNTGTGTITIPGIEVKDVTVNFDAAFNKIIKDFNTRIIPNIILNFTDWLAGNEYGVDKGHVADGLLYVTKIQMTDPPSIRHVLNLAFASLIDDINNVLHGLPRVTAGMNNPVFPATLTGPDTMIVIGEYPVGLTQFYDTGKNTHNVWNEDVTDDLLDAGAIEIDFEIVPTANSGTYEERTFADFRHAIRGVSIKDSNGTPTNNAALYFYNETHTFRVTDGGFIGEWTGFSLEGRGESSYLFFSNTPGEYTVTITMFDIGIADALSPGSHLFVRENKGISPNAGVIATASKTIEVSAEINEDTVLFREVRDRTVSAWFYHIGASARVINNGQQHGHYDTGVPVDAITFAIVDTIPTFTLNVSPWARNVAVEFSQLLTSRTDVTLAAVGAENPPALNENFFVYAESNFDPGWGSVEHHPAYYLPRTPARGESNTIEITLNGVEFHVVINRAAEPITGGEITIAPAPERGAYIANTVITPFENADITDVKWTYGAGSTAGNYFGPGRTYSVTFTLVADPGFNFNGLQADTLTVLGISTGGVKHPTVVEGVTVEVTVTFPQTATAEVVVSETTVLFREQRAPSRWFYFVGAAARDPVTNPDDEPAHFGAQASGAVTFNNVGTPTFTVNTTAQATQVTVDFSGLIGDALAADVELVANGTRIPFIPVGVDEDNPVRIWIYDGGWGTNNRSAYVVINAPPLGGQRTVTLLLEVDGYVVADFVVEINRASMPITGGAITITAPVRTALEATATNSIVFANATVSEVSWTHGIATPAGTTFGASRDYRVVFTLTANDGFNFNGLQANTLSVAGATSVTHPGVEEGTTVQVTVVFPTTAAAPVDPPLGDGGGVAPPPPPPPPTPDPTPPTPTPPPPIVEQEVVVEREIIAGIIEEGNNLVVEEEGITVEIPNDMLADLFDPENPEPITVSVAVTPAVEMDEDGNMVISETGQMLTIEVNIAVGDQVLTEIPTAITVTVSLEGFPLEDINTYRLAAKCYDEGNLKGGTFNNATGQFQFETYVVGAFNVYYVENIRNLSIPLNSFEITDRAENVDTQVMDVLPMLVEDRTLLPIRFVSNALGAEIDWAPETADRPLTVSLVLNGQSLTFGIGEMTPELTELGMDVPALLQEGRTMVPLRFIAEFFGAAVKWNAQMAAAEIQFIPSE